MSTLWQLESGGTHYSVRNSGASIRLYTNRVFHSQWNPGTPFAGGIWDCLSLPVLYRNPLQTRRVLILGLGGGAVVLQLNRLIPQAHLSAVEIDEHHLEIATRWFGVDETRANLLHSDAIDWINHYAGEPFDLIIDDLFGHASGEAVRACALEPVWLETLGRHLTADGLLITNCIDAGELRQAIPCFGDAGFRYGYRWSLPAYENVIAVLSCTSLQARVWSRNLEASDLNAASQRQARSIIRRPIRGMSQRA